jgi:hypothetical protein
MRNNADKKGQNEQHRSGYGTPAMRFSPFRQHDPRDQDEKRGVHVNVDAKNFAELPRPFH